jgi:hypothetical protein
MSIWGESYEDRREREREERREYENDVFYEVWRSGRDPDRIDYDRVDDNRWAGMDVDEAASVEIRAQQPRQQEYDFDEQYEQYEHSEEEGSE